MAGRFGSVVTAMVTPFRDDHALDLDRAQELSSWLVGNGSDSVVIAGSTGESPTVTHKEKADLFRAVGEAIRGKGKLICGTGTYSTAETLALTRGPDHIDGVHSADAALAREPLDAGDDIGVALFLELRQPVEIERRTPGDLAANFSLARCGQVVEDRGF